VSLFRIVKYSTLIYFLGRHRSKLFRSIAVLLFAFVTSLVYEDVRAYLELQHPGTLLYALIAKIVIVYGSLLFVLWQFRPRSSTAADDAGAGADAGEIRRGRSRDTPLAPPDRLSALSDIETHDRLRSRYDRVLEGQGHAPSRTSDRGGGDEARESDRP
jgi:hypothetical protein